MSSIAVDTPKPGVPNPKSLRILVADDHDLLRRGLKQLLTSHAGVRGG